MKSIIHEFDINDNVKIGSNSKIKLKYINNTYIIFYFDYFSIFLPRKV